MDSKPRKTGHIKPDLIDVDLVRGEDLFLNLLLVWLITDTFTTSAYTQLDTNKYIFCLPYQHIPTYVIPACVLLISLFICIYNGFNAAVLETFSFPPQDQHSAKPNQTVPGRL